jgi:hypothetical protein
VARVFAAASVLMFVSCGCTGLPPRGPTQSNEIVALWSQIREWRREAGMSLDPSCATLVSFAPTDAHADGCAPATSSRADTCSLGDAICDNAEQICILAGELDANLWAHDKCTSATASCHEVQQLCTRVAL